MHSLDKKLKLDTNWSSLNQYLNSCFVSRRPPSLFAVLPQLSEQSVVSTRHHGSGVSKDVSELEGHSAQKPIPVLYSTTQ